MRKPVTSEPVPDGLGAFLISFIVGFIAAVCAMIPAALAVLLVVRGMLSA